MQVYRYLYEYFDPSESVLRPQTPPVSPGANPGHTSSRFPFCYTPSKLSLPDICPVCSRPTSPIQESTCSSSSSSNNSCSRGKASDEDQAESMLSHGRMRGDLERIHGTLLEAISAHHKYITQIMRADTRHRSAKASGDAPIPALVYEKYSVFLRDALAFARSVRDELVFCC